MTVRGKTGVLLIGMGGPDRVEDVEAYLTDVRGGRPFSKEFLDDLTSKYRSIGGKSPLLDGSRAQAAALEKALNEAGLEAKVEVGMRHWKPSAKDGLKALLDWGAQRVVALCLTPYESTWSTGGYEKAFEEAVAALRPELPRSFIRSWNLEPGFLQALCDRTSAAMARLSYPLLVFTAHSLPEKFVDSGDPYVRQLEETADAVSMVLSVAPTRLAFQSRSPTGEPWLGPDVSEVLRDLKERGLAAVVLSPIGFINEHLETLYDLDVMYREEAAALGLRYERAETVGAHPGVIETWVSKIQEALHPDAIPGRIGPSTE